GRSGARLRGCRASSDPSIDAASSPARVRMRMAAWAAWPPHVSQISQISRAMVSMRCADAARPRRCAARAAAHRATGPSPRPASSVPRQAIAAGAPSGAAPIRQDREIPSAPLLPNSAPLNVVAHRGAIKDYGKRLVLVAEEACGSKEAPTGMEPTRAHRCQAARRSGRAVERGADVVERRVALERRAVKRVAGDKANAGGAHDVQLHGAVDMIHAGVRRLQ